MTVGENTTSFSHETRNDATADTSDTIRQLLLDYAQGTQSALLDPSAAAITYERVNATNKSTPHYHLSRIVFLSLEDAESGPVNLAVEAVTRRLGFSGLNSMTDDELRKVSSSVPYPHFNEDIRAPYDFVALTMVDRARQTCTNMLLPAHQTAYIWSWNWHPYEQSEGINAGDESRVAYGAFGIKRDPSCFSSPKKDPDGLYADHMATDVLKNGTPDYITKERLLGLCDGQGNISDTQGHVVVLPEDSIAIERALPLFFGVAHRAFEGQKLKHILDISAKYRRST